MNISSLFIVCSHGRRSAHGVRPTGNPGDWCPGGRPATLEDLAADLDGEKVWWCVSRGHEPRMENVSFCRWTVMSGDGGPKPGHQECGWHLLIPLPQMVAE